MTWLIAKAFLGKAGDWIAAHWQLCLFALMAFAIWHYKGAYEHSEQAITTLKANIAKESAQQVIDNKVKLDKAKDNQAASDKIAAQQIENLHIDKTTLTNAIKGYYDAPNHTKSTMVPNVGVLLSKIGDTEPAGALASGEQGLAESGGISGGTCPAIQAKVEVLENALALETIEFNKARSRVGADCLQIGCYD
jgi:hypothetical protein